MMRCKERCIKFSNRKCQNLKCKIKGMVSVVDVALGTLSRGLEEIRVDWCRLFMGKTTKSASAGNCKNFEKSEYR